VIKERLKKLFDKLNTGIYEKKEVKVRRSSKMAVKERIKTLLEQLNKGIFEKEEVMALALLSSIAGESIFLLGPPGVAKSLIARRLKYAYYKEAKVFEYLMSRFSTPDEIFGPVAISKLKEDKYERIVENYLPSADVVFLDEIWKAGPSIQNALLTILNEKIFRNGEKEIKVPIKALISASNELPAKDQGLDALWDRFLVRLEVLGISDGKKFDEMIAMPQFLFEGNIKESITGTEYEEWSRAIDGIVITDNIFNVIDVVRYKIILYNNNYKDAEDHIYVSDRRWRKIIRLMRTSAFLNDRAEVDLMDCFLIKHCIWNKNEQINAVSLFVEDAIREYGPNLDMNLYTERNEFTKLKAEIEKETSKETGIRRQQFFDNKKTGYYFLTTYFNNEYFLIESDIVDKATDNQIVTKIYSKGFAKSFDCYISKASDKNSVNLRDNYGGWQTYQFQTEPIMEPYKESPSRGDFEIWNNDTKKLLDVLDKKKTETLHFWDTCSESFYGNTFVDRWYADNCIKSKIDALIKETDKFMIEINEVCNIYQRIYKP
jgi:MoxR-like ATPase